MSVSTKIQRAVYAQQTDECFITLLRITHDELTDDIRVSSDGVNTTHDGDEYISCEFGVALPNDSDEAAPRSKLVIQNVDRTIVEAIRSVDSEVTVFMSVVLASDPDIVEIGPIEYTLKQADYDVLEVEGDIEGPNILGDPFPPNSFTPASHSGLFPL